MTDSKSLHQWIVKRLGKGVLSETEIIDLASNGILEPNDIVFSETRTKGKWVTASQIPGLMNRIENQELPLAIPISQVASKISVSQVAEREPTRFRIPRAWPILTLIASFFVWLYALETGNGSLGLWAYPLIIAVCSALAGLVARGVQRKNLVLGSAAVLATVILIWWGRNDTYTETWVDGKIKFSDQYNRWSENKVYRKIEFYKSEEAAHTGLSLMDLESESEGPIAGTGKPHGKWEHNFYFWGQDPVRWPEKRFRFYWYGEEVTEGEWYLRSK